MAFGRFARTPAAAPLHAINVTPLVDVMLVLVVVFILATPLLAASLRVQLPQAQGTAPAAGTGQALAVEITADGGLHLGGVAVDAAVLQARLAALGRQDPQAELQLRADTAVPYGRVVEVMGWAQAAGLRRLGFVAQPAEGGAKELQK